MPELRYNLITGDWVILATERAKRPVQPAAPAIETNAPSVLASCPFCPGNEHETATEIASVSDGDDKWSVRVVENRYPVLASTGEPIRQGEGFQRTISGVGRHEVVIESPLHNRTIATLPSRQVESVLRIYRDRMRAMYADSRIEHVTIFKNHGATAGCTMDHPHSQVVGTPVIPGQVRMRIEEALRHYGDQAECLFCYTLRQELTSQVRIIEQNEHFVAFIPYAALSPYHIWIFPRQHAAYFGGIDDEQLSSMARLLMRTLRRVFAALGDPHYNFVIRSLSPSEQHVKYYHWYLSIAVRVSRVAGFELGTGMFINSAFPEDNAAFLRAVPEERLNDEDPA